MTDNRIATMQDDAQETQDPQQLARFVAEAVADDAQEVGDFVEAIDLGDGVSDFRFVSLKVGYEGWQWAVTLYHDAEEDCWTVNESSLVPTKDALLAPAWVPWKDRLEATDLSVTDVIGTDPDDVRMESGVDDVLHLDAAAAAVDGHEAGDDNEAVDDNDDEDDSDNGNDDDGSDDNVSDDNVSDDIEGDDSNEPYNEPESDIRDVVNEFDLSRRHVMSAIGREETAKRWYQGQHGPKSLSTKAADGNLCSTCAFFVGLKGQLGTMFGVCANRWSLDDGRVVSFDHGCGEHSEIEQPEPTHLWVQSSPAFDDLNIDVVPQTPRKERGPINLIEAAEDAAAFEDLDQ